MGFAVSYVAFNTAPKQEVLRLARLRETKRVGTDREPFYMLAEIPTGWTLLFVDDERYASDARLTMLSANHAVLGCQVEEHSTWSSAAFYIRGRQIWRISHHNEQGDFDLDVRGHPPPELSSIRARMEHEQRTVGEKQGVSYMSDIPVQLIAAQCGFRYDRSRFSCGKPDFYGAEPVP